MKKILALILVASLNLTLFACSKNEEIQSETSQLVDITVVLDWTPNTNHTGLYVANTLGFYEEEGLSVTIIQPPEDGASLLVASNKAQFGISMQDSLAPAIISENPLPITTIATIIQHNTSGLLSLKDNGIDTPKDLENKTYATWDLPVEQAMIRDIMQKDGGDFSLLKMVPSTVTDVISALKTNIDAVWVYYAWDGIATEVANIETDYLDFGAILPEFDFYTPVIIASNEFLSTNAEQTRAFLRATARGYEYAIENPSESAEILLSQVAELDAEIVYASQEYLADKYKAEVSKWGYIDTQRWDSFYFWLEENGLTDTKVTSNMGFTNEFLS